MTLIVFIRAHAAEFALIAGPLIWLYVFYDPIRYAARDEWREWIRRMRTRYRL